MVWEFSFWLLLLFLSSFDSHKSYFPFHLLFVQLMVLVCHPASQRPPAAGLSCVSWEVLVHVLLCWCSHSPFLLCHKPVYDGWNGSGLNGA
ncbi:hypothetical protein BDW69DRAFT_142205 [Aspergillus filifer]